MRWIYACLLAVTAGVVQAQVSYPPTVAAPVDLSAYMPRAEANAAISNLQQSITAAQTTASNAATAASSAVKTVNGVTPTNGAVTLTIPAAPDMSSYATTSALATATAGVVKSVNALTPNASGAVTVPVPIASTSLPPCIGDASSAGTAGTTQFAPFNHTHCSKARKDRVLVPASGTLAVVFKDAGGNNSPFTGIPRCSVTAEATAGDTNVVNAQIDGTPTVNGMTIRITRTQQSVVAALGLTILSVPTQIATYANYLCLEP